MFELVRNYKVSKFRGKIRGMAIYQNFCPCVEWALFLQQAESVHSANSKNKNFIFQILRLIKKPTKIYKPHNQKRSVFGIKIPTIRDMGLISQNLEFGIGIWDFDYRFRDSG